MTEVEKIKAISFNFLSDMASFEVDVNNDLYCYTAKQRLLFVSLSNKETVSFLPQGRYSVLHWHVAAV